MASARNSAWAVLVLAAVFCALAPATAQPEQKSGVAEPGPAPLLADVAPAIVAEVNGAPLTREQLGGLAVGLYGRNVVEALIAAELVRQEARKQGVTVTQAEIDAYANILVERELDALAARGGYKSFAELEASGRQPQTALTELRQHTAHRLRPLVGPELLTNELVRRTVKVTPDDIQEAYERHYGPRAEILQIVLDTRQNALEVERKLKLGADFAKLARAVSTDPVSAAADGKMPLLPQRSILGAAAFRLEPGQISDVIQTPNGFHLIKLVRLLPAADQRLEDVRETIEKGLLEQRIRSERVKWLGDLRRNAAIKRHF